MLQSLRMLYFTERLQGCVLVRWWCRRVSMPYAVQTLYRHVSMPCAVQTVYRRVSMPCAVQTLYRRVSMPCAVQTRCIDGLARPERCKHALEMGWHAPLVHNLCLHVASLHGSPVPTHGIPRDLPGTDERLGEFTFRGT
jgi:hypothetical protein